jgi:predicted ester cyclase
MDNVNLVKEYIEVVSNQGKADQTSRYLSPHFQTHSLHENPQPVGATAPKDMTEAVIQTQEAFSNSHKSIDDIFAAGDQVVVRYTFTGLNSGPFMGEAPTHKEITYAGIDIYQVVDGKITEMWYVWDRLGLYQQLGITK